LAAVPWRSRKPRRNIEPASAASWRLRRAGAVATFLVATLWMVHCWADQNETNGSPRAAPAKTAVQQVFFPVDDEQKPSGTRVYVPEPLFARLERWNLDRQRGPQGMIVAAIANKIQLDWSADGVSHEPRQATAVVDLVTFDDEARVR
jgi:hypothetical protein